MRTAVGAEDHFVFAGFERGANLAGIDGDLLAVNKTAELAAAVTEDEGAVVEIDLAVIAGELVGGAVFDGEFVAGEGIDAGVEVAATNAEGQLRDGGTALGIRPLGDDAHAEDGLLAGGAGGRGRCGLAGDLEE